ncbi:MAG: hypothetical protein JWO86_7925 [Myxococcaceae bacterium]|nr:hypothetical protein [Myxococcaceae bacterium]
MRSSARSAGARVLLLVSASIAGSAAVLSVFAAAACGTDVNLGGGDDAAPAVADVTFEEVVDVCEPCSSSQTCTTAASCVQIAGNLRFCATSCPVGNECEPDEICQSMATGAGDPPALACAPLAGACTPAAPPKSDSATLEHCGNLEGPTVVASCKSCDHDDNDCQKNGCYGGWWCNTTSAKCQRPPATCP